MGELVNRRSGKFRACTPVAAMADQLPHNWFQHPSAMSHRADFGSSLAPMAETGRILPFIKNDFGP